MLTRFLFYYLLYIYFYFQKKGTIDVEERVVKAHARAGELEKQVRCWQANYLLCWKPLLLYDLSYFIQVDKLKRELETRNEKKEDFEARVNEAEKKVQELSSKLENVSIYLAKLYMKD